MSKRDEIIDGHQSHLAYGLIYTEVLGWVDLGHAQGTDIKKLLQMIDDGERSGKERYDITYSQSMVDSTRTLKMGKYVTWRIKSGRGDKERKRIALGMMMMTARRFEALQASFPVSLITDSGFSGEDLVSDLLGFYRVATIMPPFKMLRPVSKGEALKRWDYYGKIGNWKNDTFTPLLFPDPAKYPGARPRKGVLPAFMTSITPWTDFSSDVVNITCVDGSYIDKVKQGFFPYA